MDHPLLQEPAIQALSAEFLADQPACRDWPTIEVAMGTIGSHWGRVHKPGQRSVAFRNEWTQYLVLAVAYFIPFRQALTASDARCQHRVYPQSPAKLGEILSDADPESFRRLGRDFKGRCIVAEALNHGVRAQAGIGNPQALVAVMPSDSVNFVLAYLARAIDHVAQVIARVDDPASDKRYQELGVQTITTSALAAQRIAQLLLLPSLREVASVGHGDVRVYEFAVPADWYGRRLIDLLLASGILPVAIVQNGRSSLPNEATLLHPDDKRIVSATTEGANNLFAR